MKLTLTILSITGLVAAQGYGNNSSSSSSANASATRASASAAPSATPSPNIPSNITSGCSAFLSALNSATAIQSCVDPVLNAISSNNAASVSSICSAAASSSCSDTTVRTWLAYFSGNCTQEIVTNPDQNVVATYDLMYGLKPFLGAVCAKDMTGQYCLSQLASNRTAKSAGGMANAAQTPLTNSDGTLDARAFGNASILWLGANAGMDAASLCTTCTKNVLTSYIQFESSMPPVTALSKLPLLASQTPLWNAVQKTCPADFISGAISNAGASPNVANGASTSSPAKVAIVMLAIVGAGVMTL